MANLDKAPPKIWHGPDHLHAVQHVALLKKAHAAGWGSEAPRLVRLIRPTHGTTVCIPRLTREVTTVKQFVLIFGPPAVGKMTVGAALSERTGLPLFHNHMTVELILPFFGMETPAYARLVDEFRTRIFEEVAASDGPGIIFTFAWDLGNPRNKERVDRWTSIFQARGAQISYVELFATLEARLARNQDPSRLAQKPSKRDIAASQAWLLKSDRERRLNSNGDFYYSDCHLRIDNTHLSPDDVAVRVQGHLELTVKGKR